MKETVLFCHVSHQVKWAALVPTEPSLWHLVTIFVL